MDGENVIYIFAYNFANVGMKPACKGWNIFVHLYNKKVLKYGEQDVVFVNLVWVILEVTLLFSSSIVSNKWYLDHSHPKTFQILWLHCAESTDQFSLVSKCTQTTSFILCDESSRTSTWMLRALGSLTRWRESDHGSVSHHVI